MKPFKEFLNEGTTNRSFRDHSNGKREWFEEGQLVRHAKNGLVGTINYFDLTYRDHDVIVELNDGTQRVWPFSEIENAEYLKKADKKDQQSIGNISNI